MKEIKRNKQTLINYCAASKYTPCLINLNIYLHSFFSFIVTNLSNCSKSVRYCDHIYLLLKNKNIGTRVLSQNKILVLVRVGVIKAPTMFYFLISIHNLFVKIAVTKFNVPISWGWNY